MITITDQWMILMASQSDIRLGLFNVRLVSGNQKQAVENRRSNNEPVQKRPQMTSSKIQQFWGYFAISRVVQWL